MVKVRKLFGEYPLTVAVLSEVVVFDANGIAEASEATAEELTSIEHQYALVDPSEALDLTSVGKVIFSNPLSTTAMPIGITALKAELARLEAAELQEKADAEKRAELQAKEELELKAKEELELKDKDDDLDKEEKDELARIEAINSSNGAVAPRPPARNRQTPKA